MFRILSAGELRRLDALYLQLHRTAVELRLREPLARHVHLPKLPEALTVSIVAELAPALFGERVGRGPGRHDLATVKSGLLVAVKGMSAGWIAVTPTDHAADLFVLVDYADRLTCTGPVTVSVYGCPVLLHGAPRRLTTSQPRRRCAPCQHLRWHP